MDVGHRLPPRPLAGGTTTLRLHRPGHHREPAGRGDHRQAHTARRLRPRCGPGTHRRRPDGTDATPLRGGDGPPPPRGVRPYLDARGCGRRVDPPGQCRDRHAPRRPPWPDTGRMWRDRPDRPGGAAMPDQRCRGRPANPRPGVARARGHRRLRRLPLGRRGEADRGGGDVRPRADLGGRVPDDAVCVQRDRPRYRAEACRGPGPAAQRAVESPASADQGAAPHRCGDHEQPRPGSGPRPGGGGGDRPARSRRGRHPDLRRGGGRHGVRHRSGNPSGAPGHGATDPGGLAGRVVRAGLPLFVPDLAQAPVDGPRSAGWSRRVS